MMKYMFKITKHGFLTVTNSRLGNSVTGFMISDESGNRFFPTAVTDYWQDPAGIAYQQTHFSEFFPNLRTFSYLEFSINSDCHSSEYGFPETS